MVARPNRNPTLCQPLSREPRVSYGSAKRKTLETLYPQSIHAFARALVMRNWALTDQMEAYFETTCVPGRKPLWAIFFGVASASRSPMANWMPAR